MLDRYHDMVELDARKNLLFDTHFNENTEGLKKKNEPVSLTPYRAISIFR